MGFADKLANDIVGIRRVAHGIRPAQQHLKTNIWNVFAENAQPVPRIFVQEAHCCIERGSAPHLQTEQIRQSLSHGVGGSEQIVRAHARRHEGLVCIPKSRIRDEQAFFFSRPAREFLRPQFFQELTSSGRWRNSRRRRDDGRLQFLWNFLPLHFRVAVQNHVAQIGKQFRRAVAAARQAKELGGIIKERGGDLARLKLGVIHHVFRERDVCLYAANPEFAQRPVHALARFGKIRAPCRDFDK